MSNKSISDFVASKMNEVLSSEYHQSLFKSQYKAASKHELDSSDSWDTNDARKKAKKCEECKEDLSNCYCDSAMAKDKCPECHSAMDQCNCDSAMAHDKLEKLHSSAAFDVAIDSLVTASEALEVLGSDMGSATVLKIATAVAKAKKKMSPAAKKKLLERLQKGKKGKKPSSSSSKPSSKPSSKSSESSSSSSSKSSGKSSSSLKSSKKASNNYDLYSEAIFGVDDALLLGIIASVALLITGLNTLISTVERFNAEGKFKSHLEKLHSFVNQLKDWKERAKNAVYEGAADVKATLMADFNTLIHGIKTTVEGLGAALPILAQYTNPVMYIIKNIYSTLGKN